MIVFLALSVALAILLVIALAAPLARPGAAAGAEANASAELKARLGEIARQRAAGLIGPEEAREAEIEALRPALAAMPARPPSTAARRLRMAGIAAAGLLPVAAALIYAGVGAPDAAGGARQAAAATAPADPALAAAEDRREMIRGMVEGLASRLAENPEDAEGWRMLARSRAALGETEAAAGALRELLKRVEGDAADWRNFAGALMALGPGDGRKDELARAMARLEALSPDDPLALYYFGAEALAAGERARAARYFERLLSLLPADAPVRPAVEALLAEARGA